MIMAAVSEKNWALVLSFIFAQARSAITLRIKKWACAFASVDGVAHLIQMLLYIFSIPQPLLSTLIEWDYLALALLIFI